jgi:hypothetical protein
VEEIEIRCSDRPFRVSRWVGGDGPRSRPEGWLPWHLVRARTTPAAVGGRQCAPSLLVRRLMLHARTPHTEPDRRARQPPPPAAAAAATTRSGRTRSGALRRRAGERAIDRRAGGVCACDSSWERPPRARQLGDDSRLRALLSPGERRREALRRPEVLGGFRRRRGGEGGWLVDP